MIRRPGASVVRLPVAEAGNDCKGVSMGLRPAEVDENGVGVGQAFRRLDQAGRGRPAQARAPAPQIPQNSRPWEN